MTSSTPSTAWVTPLPLYRSPPSRSSTASKAPVEAPLGTAARVIVPSSRATSTSTVGFPRESRISRAPTSSMLGTGLSLATQGEAAHLPRVAASSSPCGPAGPTSPDRARLGLGVELAGVAADRLAQRVLDVPAAPL